MLNSWYKHAPPPPPPPPPQKKKGNIAKILDLGTNLFNNTYNIKSEKFSCGTYCQK